MSILQLRPLKVLPRQIRKITCDKLSLFVKIKLVWYGMVVLITYDLKLIVPCGESAGSIEVIMKRQTESC